MSVAAGLTLALLGISFAIWPYRLARISEAFDAIGRKGPITAVEPADWKVGLTRWTGLAMVFFGILVTVGQ